jgi:peptidoglycan/LPS O-acetylase OafA/YrhL
MGMDTKSDRIVHLDGLRGIAALVVVLSHIAAGFMPALYFGAEGQTAPNWHAAFATSPLFVVINGSFAVYVFFVLSGFVIAASADKLQTSVQANCLARIVRLSIPCAVSILLAATQSYLSMTWTSEAASIVDHKWIRSYVGSHALDVSVFELFGSFYLKGKSELNPILWTMRRELLGSLAIYVIYGFVKEASNRLKTLGLTGLALLVFKLEAHYYLCFVAGSVLFEFRRHVLQSPVWLGLLIFSGGLILGGRPFATPEIGSFYHLPFLFLGRMYSLLWPLGAVFIVFAVLRLAALRDFLGLSVFRFLGRISLGIYLMHFILLKSVMAFLFVLFGQYGAAEFALAATIYLVAVILVGFIFTILVDEPAMRAARAVRLMTLPKWMSVAQISK